MSLEWIKLNHVDTQELPHSAGDLLYVDAQLHGANLR